MKTVEKEVCVVHPARGFAFALEWNAADAFKANVLHVNKI